MAISANLLRDTQHNSTNLFAPIPSLQPIPLGDIFECCFKAQRSKLERLFSLKRGKRDVRALSFELSKMSPRNLVAIYPLAEILFQNFQIFHNIFTQLGKLTGKPMSKSMKIPGKRFQTVGNHVKTVGTCQKHF